MSTVEYLRLHTPFTSQHCLLCEFFTVQTKKYRNAYMNTAKCRMVTFFFLFEVMIPNSSKIKRLHIGRNRLVVSFTILPRNEL